MPPQRNQDRKIDAVSVLVQSIGGQIYLVEEGTDDRSEALDESHMRDRSPLSGLINRH